MWELRVQPKSLAECQKEEKKRTAVAEDRATTDDASNDHPIFSGLSLQDTLLQAQQIRLG